MEKIELDKLIEKSEALKKEIKRVEKEDKQIALEKLEEEKRTVRANIEALEEYKKNQREKAKKERGKEAEEKEKRMETRNKQIFTINAILGLFGALALVLWQNGHPWWAFSIGILTIVTVLYLKTKLIGSILTIGDRYYQRFFFAMGCWILVSCLTIWGLFLIPFFKDASILIKIISLASMMSLLIGITWKNFTFDVPEWTGINLYNYFTGIQTTFLPGFYCKFPWEIVKPESTHSLKSRKQETQNRNYPTGGGTVLKAEIMIQFAPDPLNLITFEGIEDNAIKQGLMEHISSILLAYIAKRGRTALEIRGNIEYLHEMIREELGIEEGEKRTLENPKKISQLTRNISPIEMSYGIRIIIAKCSDLDLEENYQRILTSERAMERIQTMADTICDNAKGNMSRKDAWDQAMILSEKATGRVVKITGDKEVIPMMDIGGDK